MEIQNAQKEKGFIAPDEIIEQDIKFSIRRDGKNICKHDFLGDQNDDSDEEERVVNVTPKDVWGLFESFIVTDENSVFSSIFNALDVILCIVSSYIYAYLAAFEKSHSIIEGNWDYILAFLDVWFALAILKSSTTSFT